MTGTRPDGSAPGRAEEREPGREARYRGFHDPSAPGRPAGDAGDPLTDPESGGRPPLPRRDTSGAGGRAGPGSAGAGGRGQGAGSSGTRPGFGSGTGPGPAGYGAGGGAGSGAYEQGQGGRAARPASYGAAGGGQDPLEQGHLPEYAHRNPLRGDPLPPPRSAEAGSPQEHGAQPPQGQGPFTQQDPQGEPAQPRHPQTAYPQPHVPRQEPAGADGPRPRPLERPESPTSAVSRWFRPHTAPDGRDPNAGPADYARAADPSQGTPRNDPPPPGAHHPGGYAPTPDPAPVPAPHAYQPDDRAAPGAHASPAYPARTDAPADQTAIVPRDGTAAQYPVSSYDAGHPSPYAEAPEAAAYGQSTSAYDPHGPAAYDPQLLGYDQAPADPLGASYPAVTGDPLTDPLDPAPPTGRRARTRDPLTDPLDPLDPPAAQAAAPHPAPRRHAGRPAVEEQQQPYGAPAHGRHAGGAAPGSAAAAGTAAGAAPSGHRDPSPWGDLSAAAHAGAPAPADPAQAQPQAQAHTAQPHAGPQAPPQTGVPAATPAPALAGTQVPGPPPGARTTDQPASGDQRLTWGTAPASRRRGIADEGREGRGDREDRTVQTMSLNVARALGTRMSARKAARAAKQQRTVLISRITGEAFITLGVLMLLFVVYQLWWTNVLADRESRQEAQQLEEQWKRGDGAGKEDARDPGAFEAGEGFAIMHIPSLDVNRPVAQGINKQKVLDRGLLGHYSEGDLKTAMPWDEKGNFAVAGHRNTHGEPFRYINRLEKGEEIIVETKDTYYIYEVSSTLPSTSPSNTDVIDPVPEGSGFTEPGRYVTLTTCTPEYTSKYRLIVWGKMIEERPRSEGKPDALMD
ncbi:class E sortase [Streptomyces sp. NPDC004134]|uniref:class E sortase n=1 Tax=Streptomyces sp. NPDC004134 TaxID=3364691 RepID=UPI0036A9A64E